LDVLPAGNDRSEVAEISVTETSRPEEKRLVSLHLPREAHVMLVTRGREHFVPARQHETGDWWCSVRSSRSTGSGKGSVGDCVSGPGPLCGLSLQL